MLNEEGSIFFGLVFEQPYSQSALKCVGAIRFYTTCYEQRYKLLSSSEDYLTFGNRTTQISKSHSYAPVILSNVESIKLNALSKMSPNEH